MEKEGESEMNAVNTSPPNPSFPSYNALAHPSSFLSTLFSPHQHLSAYSHTYIHNETCLQLQETEKRQMAAGGGGGGGGGEKGGGGGGGKSDDFQPFAVKDQLPGVDFCLSSSPPWRTLLFICFFCSALYYTTFVLALFHYIRRTE